MLIEEQRCHAIGDQFFLLEEELEQGDCLRQLLRLH